MKLAAISDIHGNLAALQAVLEDIDRQQVDQVVNLGDILSGPLQPAETADLLMAKNFVTVAGNHERQLLQVLDRSDRPIDPLTSDGYAATKLIVAQVQWVRAIPAFHWISPDVLLVHGTPGSDLVYWLETTTPDFGQHGSSGIRAATADEVQQRLASGPDASRASLVLCGHTHVPRAAQCGTTLIVNPGSVGLQAYGSDYPHFHHTENGSPHARYAIVERASAGWRQSAAARTGPTHWPQAGCRPLPAQ